MGYDTIPRTGRVVNVVGIRGKLAKERRTREGTEKKTRVKMRTRVELYEADKRKAVNTCMHIYSQKLQHFTARNYSILQPEAAAFYSQKLQQFTARNFSILQPETSVFYSQKLQHIYSTAHSLLWFRC